MEIPLFVLVLQIGFIAALNNRGYNGNPVIPSARFVNYGLTRRLPDSDSYQPLSSRGIPAIDSAQSDDEYSSFEDYSFRSVRPQSRPNLRRNNYLRHNTEPENDVSLKSAPFGRINSNDYVEYLQASSPISRGTDTNFRRPYLRNGLSNLRQSSTRKSYRKAKDNLSLEVSSLESSNPEDPSRLGEEASYRRSLLSLIEQPNNKRGQNRKYFREANSLSPDVSPIDKLDLDEDGVNSLLGSLNKRKNYRKKYNNPQIDLRMREPSRVKDIPDAYIDTILLVTDDDKPDEISIGRPKLESPETTGLGNNNLYNRRHGDGLTLDTDIANNLSPFRGLKPRSRSRKLPNNSPLTRRFNRKSNDNAGLESSLNDELFPDDGKAGQLTLLRLASLENMKLESPLLRSGDQKNHSNRKSNRKNFLRLSLSPNNKLTLDEGVASDLSELLSETLDELNLVPVNLRRTGLTDDTYSRRKNNRLSTEEVNLNNIPVLLGSVDIPNAELSLRRYHELANRSNNRNLRKHENNREALKKLFDDNPYKNLVPYHEFESSKLPNSRINGKLNNNRRNDFSDEFSLDTLFNFREEDHDDRLDLDDNFSSDLSVLRSINQNHLSLEPPHLRSSDKNLPKLKDTDNILQLEFPWNDPLSSNSNTSKSHPNKSKTGGLRSQAALRNTEQKYSTKDTTDKLHLEFPWNDPLSPDENKTGRLSSQTQLRSPKEKDNTKDTNDTLHLEFPWNDQLNPSRTKTSNLSALRNLQTHLRSPEQKYITNDTTDILHLEFPWNDPLSSENDKSGKPSALRNKSQLRNSKEKDNNKDTTDTLHLEFPWNDQLSPSKAALRDLKSHLRSPEQKYITKDTTDILNLEFPWNDPLSSENDKIGKLSSLRSKSQLRNSKEKGNSKETTDILHLEFPWNGALSSEMDKTSNPSSLRELKSHLRSSKQKDNANDTADILHLEFPWNDPLSSDSDKGKLQLRSQKKKDNTKDTTDTLHLEFPWNDELSSDENKTSKLKSQSLLRSQSDSRQDKESKDDLKLEFPWNDKPSPNKPSSKTTVLSTPDPFYVHPYLRNRNIKKHPNYFRRSYNEFTEGTRLEKLKDSPPESHHRHSNRRFNDNQSLRVIPLAREDFENDTVFRDTDEDPSGVITFPLGSRPNRLSVQARGTTSFLTTTVRPNDTESILKLNGDKNDRMTYNDTIIFPKN